MRTWLGIVVAVIITLAIMGAALCLIQAVHADPPAPPTPAPVIGTGGEQSGSDPGSSCVSSLLPQRFVPAPGSNPYAWAQPDWPGFFVITTPVPGAATCSR